MENIPNCMLRTKLYTMSLVYDLIRSHPIKNMNRRNNQSSQLIRKLFYQHNEFRRSKIVIIKQTFPFTQVILLLINLEKYKRLQNYSITIEKNHSKIIIWYQKLNRIDGITNTGKPSTSSIFFLLGYHVYLQLVFFTFHFTSRQALSYLIWNLRQLAVLRVIMNKSSLNQMMKFSNLYRNE